MAGHSAPDNVGITLFDKFGIDTCGYCIEDRTDFRLPEGPGYIDRARLTGFILYHYLLVEIGSNISNYGFQWHFYKSEDN